MTGLLETYSYGKCIWFALALHDLTGWPIQAIVGWQGDTFHGDNYVDHCWCLTPDGLRADVAGPDGGRDFGGDDHIRTFTRPEFVALLKLDDPEELSLALSAARQVFPR